MPSSQQGFFPRTLVSLALALAAASGHAADFSFSGQITAHKDVVLIDFMVDAPGMVRLWTDSWQGGLNFDPMFSLFDASNTLVASNDDDDTVSPGQGFYDAGLHLPLAGAYHLALTASSNAALGPWLAQGFTYSADTPILLSQWVQPSSDINLGDQKGGAWQLHLSGVAAAAPVPEPESVALMLAGLLGIGFMVRRSKPR